MKNKIDKMLKKFSSITYRKDILEFIPEEELIILEDFFGKLMNATKTMYVLHATNFEFVVTYPFKTFLLGIYYERKLKNEASL